MWNILHRGSDIDDVVTLHYAQTEIVEIHELHGCPSLT
jgi:hypothetical protein